MKTIKLTLGALALSTLAACGGGGGSSSDPTSQSTSVAPTPPVAASSPTTVTSVPKITPLKVYATSYENQMAVGASGTNTHIPNPSDIPGLQLDPGSVGYFSGRAAFADFFQDGTFSAVVFAPNYTGALDNTLNPNHAADGPDRIYFLRKDSSGNWTDQTSTLIKDGNNHACITSSFIEVADINNDGKPDVLISCTGTDFPIQGNLTFAQMVQYLISKQFELLSQPDGSYKLIEIPVTSPQGAGIYAHQATLADIDGDGNLDILYVDPHGNETPFIMWGDGKGSFKQDMTRFPASMLHRAIFGIRAIPINGVINVIVSGSAPGSSPGYNPNTDTNSFGVEVLQYIGGKFQVVTQLVPPQDPKTGYSYSLGLDYIYTNGSLYSYMVDYTYLDNAIVKYNVTTGAGSVVRADSFSTSFSGDGSGEITLHGSTIESVMTGCGPSSSSPTDFNFYACSFSVTAQ